MRALIAITRLALRSALYSRLPVWLFVSTMSCVLFMPLFLHGDGSTVGHMRMVIAYPLSVAFGVLVLGTLWLSAGAVAREVFGRQLQSVVVKPVHPLAIWFGKWLAISIINIALVFSLMMGLMFSVMMASRGRRSSPDEISQLREQVLVGRRAIAPQPIPDLLDAAEHTRQRLIRQRVIDSDTGIDRIINELKIMHSTASPGRSVSWEIPFDAAASAAVQDSRIMLRYRFQCSPFERRPVSGVWTVEQKENGTSVSMTVSNQLDGAHVVFLPESFNPQKGTIRVSFRTVSAVGTTDTSKIPTLYFDADLPVELLVRGSGFISNILRSSIVLVALLGCIAAIGLAMSSMFSFPVAAFSSVAIIFAVTIAGGFSEDTAGCSHESAPPAIVRLTQPLLLALKRSFSGITGSLPISDLADGMLYSWSRVAESLLPILLIIFVMGLISGIILGRKELAA